MQSIAIIRFSAIARSIMISAFIDRWALFMSTGFSAIARSIMISADREASATERLKKFQCYSS